MDPNGVNLLYLVTIVCFVLALRFLSSPATARRGNQIGAVGMVDRDRRDAAEDGRARDVADGRRAQRSAARSERSAHVA